MPVSTNGTSSGHGIIGVSAPRCHFCGKELDFEFDYSCIICGHITCDNHQDVCQEYDEDYEGKGCDLVTCYVCLEAHTKTCHSDVL